MPNKHARRTTAKTPRLPVSRTPQEKVFDATMYKVNSFIQKAHPQWGDDMKKLARQYLGSLVYDGETVANQNYPRAIRTIVFDRFVAVCYELRFKLGNAHLPGMDLPDFTKKFNETERFITRKRRRQPIAA